MTLRPLSGHFDGTTHHFACRVYFEDTDLSGIVYHANYLRFCERARSDMLRCIGIEQRSTFEGGNGVYAVSEMAIKYVRPAKLDDDLLILSTVTQIRAAACRIHQRVMRLPEESIDGGGAQAEFMTELFHADVLAAFINPTGRPIRQPRPWIDAFNSVLCTPAD